MSCQLRKMKMMAAASCDARAPETQCGKEVAARLAQIQAERIRQDQMWTEPIKSEPASANNNGAHIPTKSGSVPSG
jgi:hypothetical protein